jgi:hypothetical protein
MKEKNTTYSLQKGLNEIKSQHTKAILHQMITLQLSLYTQRGSSDSHHHHHHHNNNNNTV